ncbi:hypothetical protein SARC_09685 [Sphaeroforma arctica JP610]|uniref:Glycoside-hydrolase family GH114 TIM-barrel domain-containing protein n=1 Tax=Sphaeroforma arctica JP610 TaxID=667725 RepID=A0A0L0FM51_9EUKA|nr:hypothetical protein SARC_09685 [Sphaeroforma arctica JP610]KNC77864.1 hypothetical protein SARC_09685 [Sphaeroforma arctica JP610]|eukprot:XP_014151766.1 hypothetical protein SARC_09685 [Sphaeroforma arctica JP610]
MKLRRILPSLLINMLVSHMHVLAQSANDRVLVPSNSSWSLAAFEGNVESIAGRKVVFLDFEFNTSPQDMAQLGTTIGGFVNANRLVVCAISLGAVNLDDTDIALFPDEVRADEVAGAFDTPRFYLDITQLDRLQDPLTQRITTAQDAGCQAIMPLLLDCSQASCVNSTDADELAQQQMDYNMFVISTAQNNGVSVGLYDVLSSANSLPDVYDFAYSQQCNNPDGFDDCLALSLFITMDKAVFVLGDALQSDDICTQSENLTFGAKVTDDANNIIDCNAPEDTLPATATVGASSTDPVSGDTVDGGGFDWCGNTLGAVLVFLVVLLLSGCATGIVLCMKARNRRILKQKQEMEKMFYGVDSRNASISSGIGANSARSSNRSSLPMSPAQRGVLHETRGATGNV